MRFLTAAALTALLLTMAIPAQAQTVEFDFETTAGNGVFGAAPNFDPSILGDTVRVSGLGLTIVDLTFPEYDVSGAVPVETGVTLSAVAGDGGSTSVGGQGALGFNNPSINNATFNLIGNGSEGNDINPGEALTFTFDQDVVFTTIELESVLPADMFNVLVNGKAMLETTGDDLFIDDLGGLTGLTIMAGEQITFAVDGVLETATGGAATSIRIQTFTVNRLDTDEEVLFDFRTNGGVNGVANVDPVPDFDPGVAGETVIVAGLGVTIVDITAPEYDVTGDLPVETGVILSSAAGDVVATNISGQEALGINNPSIGNGTFDLIGNGGESSDLNPGETVTITFDQDVQFTAIELESVGAADIFNVLVDGELVLGTMGDDGVLDGLGGLTDLTIEAGTEVTFAVDGVLETATGGPATSLRIVTFTVDIIESEILLGDVNLDGEIDFLDIVPFINLVTGGGFQAEADIDPNGIIDFLDIVPFINILTGV